MANTLNLGNGNWATKEDSLLAYNSENGNFKPLPFDFARASSATVVNKAGLIETVGSGEPRIDFKDDAKGALLLEPQRSNLLTYSEDFSNSYWTKNNSSVTSGFASPSGDLSAFKLVENTANSGHFIKRRIDTSSNFLSNSIFVKAGEVAKIGISESGATDDYASFDLSNGVLIASGGNPSFSIKEMSNDWYRISLKSDSQLSRNDFNLALLSDDYVSGVPYSQSYQGDGTSGVYIYGAQLEQGSYATSYIPTSGSAVTRSADSSSQTVPDGVIGQTEGTVFLDFKILTEDEINCNIFNTNKNTTNAIAVIRTKWSKLLQVQTFFNSVNVNYLSTNTYNVGDKIKLAFKYKNSDVKLYINGILENSATPTFTISSSLSEINLADNFTYFARKEGVDYTSLQLYNTALTDQELIALTTI